MVGMLTPQCKISSMKCMSHPNFACLGGDDGIVKAVVHNPAVSTLLIDEIYEWMEEGCTMDDVVTRLRARTVPRGYEFHTWIKGTL